MASTENSRSPEPLKVKTQNPQPEAAALTLSFARNTLLLRQAESSMPKPVQHLLGELQTD